MSVRGDATMSAPSNDDALADPWQVVVRGRSGPWKCRPRSRVTGRAREERAGAEEREDGGAQPDGDGEMQPLRQPRHRARGHLLSPRSKTRETHQVWTRAAAAQARTRDIEDEVRQRLRHHEHHPEEYPKRRSDGQATRALSQSPGRSVLSAQRPVRSSWANSEWTVQVESIRGTSRLSRRPPRARSQSCLLYTSPSPRDRTRSRMPSSA